MNRWSLPLIFAVTVMVGCSGPARYRVGGQEEPLEFTRQPAGMTTNDYIRFGKIVQDYLGRPYGGKSPYDKRLDCSLFSREVFRRFNGTDLPRTARDQYRSGREVPYRSMSYGDLVFFRTSSRRISHVGIFLGEQKFVHVSSSNGVIISSLREKYWSSRFVGARRVLP